MKRALLLTNPYARRGEATQAEVIQTLQDLGFDLVATFAESPQFFADRICEYQHQVDVVVIGGGDGSVLAARYRCCTPVGGGQRLSAALL